jgi:predicted GNAT family acetyltransferase
VTVSPESDVPTHLPDRATVRPADPIDIPAIRAFLERHVETSVFLLANLTELGIHVTSSPLSGNFVLVEEDAALAGVFCLTRRGDLLVQTGGRIDFVDGILDACASEPFPLTGVIAEWTIADAIWSRLLSSPGFASHYHCKSVVYCLDHLPDGSDVPHEVVVRELTAADYEIWEPIDRAFQDSEGLQVMPDEARRRAGYRMRADVGGWWGAFARGELVSTACLNAAYGGLGQIGGVYTRPDYRRRGLARRVMAELTRAHRVRSGVERLVLFAAERNRPARTLYESMGFAERGRFGLLFGLRADDTIGRPQGPPLRHQSP